MSPCPECQGHINDALWQAIRHERELREASERFVAVTVENGTLRNRTTLILVVTVAVALVGFVVRISSP